MGTFLVYMDQVEVPAQSTRCMPALELAVGLVESVLLADMTAVEALSSAVVVSEDSHVPSDPGFRRCYNCLLLVGHTPSPCLLLLSLCLYSGLHDKGAADMGQLGKEHDTGVDI